jgi:hypothetical protein
VAKRTRENEEETGRETRKASDFGHEIWGLLYIAIAVLVLIALVSHFINHGSNILGQYLGSALAGGLIFLFGVIPAFFIPVGIGYLGWLRLRGDRLTLRSMFSGALFVLEICVLLAIHKLPLIAAGKQAAVDANWIGVSVVRLLKPLFGNHQFGPYFIVGIAFTVTMLLSFNISPLAAAKAIATAAGWLYARFAAFWARLSERRVEEPSSVTVTENTPSPAGEPAPDKKQKQRSRKEAALAEAAAAVTSSTAPEAAPDDPVEAEKRKLFEEELANFRAKRSEPIQIMTVETTEMETDDPQIDASRVRIEGDEEEEEEEKGTPRKRRTMPVAEEAPATEAVPLKPYEIPNPDICPTRRLWRA